MMETGSHENENENENNENGDDIKFYPYAYPHPNMLVQSGSKVLIKGLTSAAAGDQQQLNGLVGTALEFHADRHGHWSVQLDDVLEPQLQEEDEDENDHAEKETLKETCSIVVMIPILNLELVVPQHHQQQKQQHEQGHTTTMTMYFPIVTRQNPRWAAGSRNGRVLLRAGTMMGQAALCLYDDPNRLGFDATLVYQQAQYMGASRAMVDELLKGAILRQHQQQQHPQQQLPTRSLQCISERRQHRQRNLMMSSHVFAMMVIAVGGFSLLAASADMASVPVFEDMMTTLAFRFAVQH
jgi:hypothetical protein